MNEQIELTKQAIVSCINNSNLPIGVINLIVKDISNQLEGVYRQTLIKEHEQKEEQTEGETGE